MGEFGAGAIGAAGGGPEGMQPMQEVHQHGTIGNFLGSSLEGKFVCDPETLPPIRMPKNSPIGLLSIRIGVESGFIRCVYTAKNRSANTVTLLCEKMEGCCLGGCCPKDQFWMTGLWILLVFVLLLLCCGTVVMLLCYQRSKVQQRRAEKELYEASSRVAPPGGLSELASPSGGIYARPMYGSTMAQPTQHHHQQQQQAAQQMHHYGTTSQNGHYGVNNGGAGGTASRRF